MEAGGDRGPLRVPASWRALEPEELRGAVLVVGATDRGKSSFARYLVGALAEAGGPVGWLDADVGQSTLGAPATANLALVWRAAEALPPPEATVFVGATSPVGHMLPCLVAVERLRRRAEARGASALVVDTTGLVSPERGGVALKRWKAELLQPCTVVALDREGELEPLLGPWERDSRFRVVRLAPPPGVRCRSLEERARRRRAKFRAALAGGREWTLPWEGLPIYGRELAAPGRLLALQDEEGWTLGLGVCLSAEADRLRLYSPVPGPERVAGVRFGSVRLDPRTGEEGA
ncbi:MAG: hypothetical protein Kow0092_01920 [Deferrisomatales bacterium]